MLLIKNEDIFRGAEAKGLILVTCNSVVVGPSDNRKLVMGAGIAKRAAKLYEWLPEAAGQAIANHKTPHDYGLITFPNKNVGCFQTKRHFRNNSTIYIIENSVSKLKKFIVENPSLDIHLNFPGIGFGGLTKDEVLPLLKDLPITLYEI